MCAFLEKLISFYAFYLKAKEMEPKTLYDTLEQIAKWRQEHGHPNMKADVKEYEEYIGLLESLLPLSPKDLIDFQEYVKKKGLEGLEGKIAEMKKELEETYQGRLEVINNLYISYLSGKILDSVKTSCENDIVYSKIRERINNVFKEFEKEEMKRDLPDL